MTRYKTIARYAPFGFGFNVWAPGEDRPEYWFSTKQEVFEFAKACGWKKIKAI